MTRSEKPIETAGVARRLLLGLVLISVFLAALRSEQLAGDPGIYRERMLFVFGGELPYIDIHFEHLPFAIVPMALAWLLGGAFGETLYTIIFAALMVACLLATSQVMRRAGSAVGVLNAEVRWVVLAAPLLPIVLFRYEPLVVALVAASLLASIQQRDRAALWTSVLAVLTKGWPVVLSLTDWWRGSRWRAGALLATAAGLFGVLATFPGFSRVREFSGIHSESVMGGVFVLARDLTSSALGVLSAAGATYVAVPTWAVVVNLTLGVAVFGLALYRASGEFTWDKGIRLLGAATVAILIGAPLLSPQFLLWPTPFLALHPNANVRRLAVAASALTLVYMLGWNPGFEGDLWWVGVMNLRNVVLVALGVVAAIEVGERALRTPGTA